MPIAIEEFDGAVIQLADESATAAGGGEGDSENGGQCELKLAPMVL